MDLEVIVNRLVEALIKVDSLTETQRESRSGSGAYIQCVGTLWEDDFTKEALIQWNEAHPDDFSGFSKSWVEVRYPTGRGNCDLCIRSSDYQPSFGEPPFEWAIEMKYVRFIGDNGKNNDYGVTKVASPYRKDRSSVLDAERLLDFNLAKRKAIVMYGFEFDSASHDHALHWCETVGKPEDKEKNLLRTKNMKSVLHKEDPDYHNMSMLDLVPLFQAAVGVRDISLSDLEHKSFDGLMRHPLYRKGRILAWEVIE